MKLATFITVGALCITTGAFQGGSVRYVAAEDSAVSADAALAAESALDTVESMVDTKDIDCLAQGFDAETLDCRVCNLLALSLSLTQDENTSQTDAVLAASKQRATENAVAKCQRCCTDVAAIDAHTHTRQYARVVLEVCTCKFGRLPKIANFVNHHAAVKHPRLEIEYINARMPHLLFYDDAGVKQEEISIASWDEETISEFIEAKLKVVDDDAAVTEEAAVEGTVEGEEEVAVDATEEGEEASEETEGTAEDVVEVEVSADTQ